MYPETDVPPIRITQERLDRLRAELPEMPEVRLEKIVATYKLPRQQAAQLIEDGVDDAFEAIVRDSDEPQVVANALTYQFAEIRREGLDVDAIVAAHEPMIRERGERATAALMGVAMGQLRGRADGGVISEKLRARVAAKLASDEGR